MYSKVNDSDFSSESREELGYFVGIDKHFGHAMMYKLFMDDTKKIIYQLIVHSALDPASKDCCIDFLNGEPLPSIIESHQDNSHRNSDGEGLRMYYVDMDLFHNMVTGHSIPGMTMFDCPFNFRSNDTSTNMSGYKSDYKSDYTTDVKSLADDDPNAVDGETNEKTDMITGLFITGTLWIAAHTCSEQGNTIDVLDLRKD